MTHIPRPLARVSLRSTAALSFAAALAFLSACSKSDAPTTTSSSSAAAAPSASGWDDDAAAKLIAADAGSKRIYVCQLMFPDGLAQTAIQAMDRPSIGAKRVAANQVSISATTSDQAHKIMEAATRHSLQIGPCAADLAEATVDASVPLSSYTPLQSGLQLALLYYGLGKQALPTGDLAQVFDADYQHTTDTFKKQDMLASVQSRYASQQQALVSAPYLKIAASARLGHYDPKTKAFPFLDFSATGDTRFQMNDSFTYGVVVKGDQRFGQISESSEADARAIEAKVSAYTNGNSNAAGLPINIDIYVKTADTLSFANRDDIVAKIVAIHVADTNGSPIADIR